MRPCHKFTTMYKKFIAYKGNNQNWFNNEVKGQKRLHERAIEEGRVKDDEYVWPALFLSIFIEGVFTRRPVPQQIEVEVPGGILRITTIAKSNEIKWLVRNDTFSVIAQMNVLDMADWAIKNYPDGIGSEGYLIAAHRLLTVGCQDDTKAEAIWNAMFYKETESSRATSNCN